MRISIRIEYLFGYFRRKSYGNKPCSLRFCQHRHIIDLTEHICQTQRNGGFSMPRGRIRNRTEEDRINDQQFLSSPTEGQSFKKDSVKSINTEGECCAYMGSSPSSIKCNCVTIPCSRCFIYANYKPTAE